MYIGHIGQLFQRWDTIVPLSEPRVNTTNTAKLANILPDMPICYRSLTDRPSLGRVLEGQKVELVCIQCATAH